MAEYLIAASGRTLTAAALGIGILVILPAYAAELIDPTRPPASALVEGNATAQQTTAEPVLQSILISPRRKEAIISGQTVKVGDGVGEAKVVKITEDEVVLRSGKDLQTLKVFPGIEKRSASGRAGIQLRQQRQ